MTGKVLIITFLIAIITAPPLFAEETKEAEGTILNLWPLVDYRESSTERYSNLSILGPLFKIQHRGNDRDFAVRPFFFGTDNQHNGTAVADYFYPLASSDSSPEAANLQVLELYQKNIYRKDEGEKKDRGTMVFPFYISGRSEKYGPYTSFTPFYGDLYERFRKDEYHFVMFPLYGRTVKKGTTNRNYLYPFFSTTEGEKESGYQIWPIYGQSAKEGVYSKRFVLWPFFMREESGLDTNNPTRKFYLLPLYASSVSPQSTSRYYLWPFFGYMTGREGNQKEWDYFWPFWRKVRGEKRNLNSYLPFYSLDRRAETSKRWIMWPLYKHEEMESTVFRQEKEKVFYFLYTDDREIWPKAPGEKRRTALWPLFLYNLNSRGVKSLSFPAPLEPIVDREGIEKNWAPLWRLYQQKWNDNGDSAVSVLWNLYWHEKRGPAIAYEFYPFFACRSEHKQSDIKIIKGLVRFQDNDGRKGLTFFWLPFGFHWGEKAGQGPGTIARSEP
jgi:hypothetical protein